MFISPQPDKVPLPFAKPLFPAPNRQANFFLMGPVPAQGCEEQELQNQIKNRLSIPLFPCLPAAEAGKAALFASDSPLHPALAHAFPLLRFAKKDKTEKGPDSLQSRGLDLFSQTTEDYSLILVTTPEPTVRPPSRIAKRRPSSIAIGVISSTSMVTLSPGMHISTPSGREMVPVTSVVRK